MLQYYRVIRFAYLYTRRMHTKQVIIRHLPYNSWRHKHKNNIISEKLLTNTRAREANQDK